jgi:KipI family sensor histidine kinase inhibitor
VISESVRAQPLGDGAVSITLGSERSTNLLWRAQATAAALWASRNPGLLDVVPTYVAVTVFYDPLVSSYMDIAPALLAVCESINPASVAATTPRTHDIPVDYDGQDLADVAAACGLTVEDVVTRHSARTYTVDLIGFVPGFAYLSELDPTLQLPRRPQPRPRVRAGSVAIAGSQTAVYPLDTPGGWHLIGTTDTVMFDPTRAAPALLAPGDSVRFVRAR